MDRGQGFKLRLVNMLEDFNCSLFISAVLITGSVSLADRRTAEIYNPLTKTSCSLPKFPEAEDRYYHSQEGDLACGGEGSSSSTRTTCVKWSPASGTWTRSHSLSVGRYDHVSWATGSGVYLMGGYSGPRTSEKVKEDGSVEDGFVLKYELRFHYSSSLQ